MRRTVIGIVGAGEPSEQHRRNARELGRLIAERGYPTGDYDDRLAHLSVEHARTLDHYRKAHEINERNSRGEATTEQLRQALVHYRALFADLLGTEPLAGSTPNSTHDRSDGPNRERQP